MEKNTVGVELSSRRVELSLTQKQVADYVGVTEATVSRWESGKIDNMRRDKIAKLANILRVSPLLIMGISEMPKRIEQPAPPPLADDESRLLKYFRALPEASKQALLMVATQMQPVAR